MLNHEGRRTGYLSSHSLVGGEDSAQNQMLGHEIGSRKVTCAGRIPTTHRTIYLIILVLKKNGKHTVHPLPVSLVLADESSSSRSSLCTSGCKLFT